MRVLVLHPEASSARRCHRQLSALEDRLWNRHGIELVFVDAPLLDARVGRHVGAEGGGLNSLDCRTGERGDGDCRDGDDDDDGMEASRRWYVREEAGADRAAALPPPRAAPDGADATVRYSGLDASLLHLSQVWTRGGANASNVVDGGGNNLPFSGVLGVGQGASVAGLLPLLNRRPGGDDDDSDDGNNLDNGGGMFRGMQFAIMIDGEDILGDRRHDAETEEDYDLYVNDPEGVRSLHVVLDRGDGHDDERRRSGERLARQYGANARVHRVERVFRAQPPDAALGAADATADVAMTPAIANVVGKFLVSRKNALRNDSTSRELLSLRTRLANVERIATLAMSEEIRRNPPRALMAVIGPAAVMTCAAGKENENNAIDSGEGGGQSSSGGVGGEGNVKVVDKAVGAWQGPRRRGFGEEGGGAPCPEEFLLREEERRRNESGISG